LLADRRKVGAGNSRSNGFKKHGFDEIFPRHQLQGPTTLERFGVGDGSQYGVRVTVSEEETKTAGKQPGPLRRSCQGQVDRSRSW